MVNIRNAKRAGPDTGAAHSAFFRVDLGHHPSHLDFVLAQNFQGPGRCGFGLGDAVSRIFGIKTKACQIDTLTAGIHRFHLFRGFGKKSVTVQIYPEDIGQFLIAVSHNCALKGDKVGCKTDGSFQDRIVNCHLELILIVQRLDHRLVLKIITDKDHPFVPCFLVKVFPFSVCAHLSIKDINIHARVFNF